MIERYGRVVIDSDGVIVEGFTINGADGGGESEIILWAMQQLAKHLPPYAAEDGLTISLTPVPGASTFGPYHVRAYMWRVGKFGEYTAGLVYKTQLPYVTQKAIEMWRNLTPRAADSPTASR